MSNESYSCHCGQVIKKQKNVSKHFSSKKHMNYEQKENFYVSPTMAKQIAQEWTPLFEAYMESAIRNQKQHRDIGKVLAYIAEEWVAKNLMERTGRPIKNVYGESYDGITNDDYKPVRHQVKFRQSTWHLETTRRNSVKNKDRSATGHVAYASNEFDALAIFIPGPAFSLTSSKLRVIPSSVLIDKDKPMQMMTSAEKLKKEYDCDKKTEQVIQMIYRES